MNSLRSYTGEVTGWGGAANLAQMGLGPPVVATPKNTPLKPMTAPRTPSPVRPITLPPEHPWHPLPPVAFKLPKEPALKSSQAKVLKLPQPHLKSTITAKPKAIKV